MSDPNRPYQDANAIRRGAERHDPDTKKTLDRVARQIERVGDADADERRRRGGTR